MNYRITVCTELRIDVFKHFYAPLLSGYLEKITADFALQMTNAKVAPDYVIFEVDRKPDPEEAFDILHECESYLIRVYPDIRRLIPRGHLWGQEIRISPASEPIESSLAFIKKQLSIPPGKPTSNIISFPASTEAAEIVLSEDNESKAIQLLRKASDTDDPTEKKQLAEQILELTPEDTEAKLMLELASASSQKEALLIARKASESAKKNLILHGDDLSSYIHEQSKTLGPIVKYQHMLQEEGMITLAAAEADQILAAASTWDYGMQHMKMCAYAYFEDAEGAEEYFEECGEPLDAGFLLPLSILYFKLGKFITAEKYLKKLAQVVPETGAFMNKWKDGREAEFEMESRQRDCTGAMLYRHISDFSFLYTGHMFPLWATVTVIGFRKLYESIAPEPPKTDEGKLRYGRYLANIGARRRALKVFEEIPAESSCYKNALHAKAAIYALLEDRQSLEKLPKKDLDQDVQKIIAICEKKLMSDV